MLSSFEFLYVIILVTKKYTLLTMFIYLLHYWDKNISHKNYRWTGF